MEILIFKTEEEIMKVMKLYIQFTNKINRINHQIANERTVNEK